MNEFASIDAVDRQIRIGIGAARVKAGHVGQVVILDNRSDPEIVWEGETEKNASDAFFDARLVLGHALERLLAGASDDLNSQVDESTDEA